MRNPEGPTQDDAKERDARLHRLTEIFAPHVREMVAEAAESRTLRVPMGRFNDVAGHVPGHDLTLRSIIDRALAAEAKLMVTEWTLLVAEHATETGRTLRLSTLDEAMLPPFAADLRTIFEACCGRRLAGPALTRVILARVRASLPAGQILPPDAAAYFRSRGIELVS